MASYLSEPAVSCGKRAHAAFSLSLSPCVLEMCQQQTQRPNVNVPVGLLLLCICFAPYAAPTVCLCRVLVCLCVCAIHLCNTKGAGAQENKRKEEKEKMTRKKGTAANRALFLVAPVEKPLHDACLAHALLAEQNDLVVDLGRRAHVSALLFLLFLLPEIVSVRSLPVLLFLLPPVRTGAVLLLGRRRP